MTRREMLEQLADEGSCSTPRSIDCNDCPALGVCRHALLNKSDADVTSLVMNFAREQLENEGETEMGHNHNDERDDDEPIMAEFLRQLRAHGSDSSPARDATPDERSDLIPLNLEPGDKVEFGDHPYMAGGWPKIVTIHRHIFPAQDMIRGEGGTRMFRFDYTVILANDRPDGTVNLEEHPIDSRYFRKV